MKIFLCCVCCEKDVIVLCVVQWWCVSQCGVVNVEAVLCVQGQGPGKLQGAQGLQALSNLFHCQANKAVPLDLLTVRSRGEVTSWCKKLCVQNYMIDSEVPGHSLVVWSWFTLDHFLSIWPLDFPFSSQTHSHYQWTRTEVSSSSSCSSEKLTKSSQPTLDSSSIQTTEPIVNTMSFAVLLCVHQKRLAVWISLRIMTTQSSQTTTTHYSNICWYTCIEAKGRFFFFFFFFFKWTGGTLFVTPPLTEMWTT